MRDVAFAASDIDTLAARLERRRAGSALLEEALEATPDFGRSLRPPPQPALAFHPVHLQGSALSLDGLEAVEGGSDRRKARRVPLVGGTSAT